jgi:hypothetical protein
MNQVIQSYNLPGLIVEPDSIIIKNKYQGLWLNGKNMAKSIGIMDNKRMLNG